MERSIQELIAGQGKNYILPFLWLREESTDLILEEMEKIKDCGIGAVCVEARPHPDFAGPRWWNALDAIMDYARKYDMRVWVLDDSHFPTGFANGLIKDKYPERGKIYLDSNFTEVQGPLPYGQLNIEDMLKPSMTWQVLFSGVKPPLMEENKMISVTAVKAAGGDKIGDTMIDLTPYVKDNVLTYDFPEGLWKVFVNFTTRNKGGRPDYINIIDSDSVDVQIEAVYQPHYDRYKDDFGKTFAGFFSDEPSMGNAQGFGNDEIVGKKKAVLPWCQEACEMMRERLGDNWQSLLPYLWFESENDDVSVKVRFEYMDVVTRLYEKNFSCKLGQWCEERGVEYIGHVIEDNNVHCRLGCGTGHYFRAMTGQHMAGIDNIGGQLIFGGEDYTRYGFGVANGEFHHYLETKMGASSAHLDPAKKGRLMCETYGAYGWHTGVRHMKWITDKLIVQGVNHLVPHAFSIAEYPDPDCPPHFYARGNNPQYKHFGHLMRYANRLCHIFNDGVSTPSAAILYEAENYWVNEGLLMQKPARVLTENQIDFEIIPEDVLDALEQYNGIVDGSLLKINGMEISVLFVPETKYVEYRLAKFIQENPQFKVVFINSRPTDISNVLDKKAVKELLAAIGTCDVVSLDEIGNYCHDNGFYDILLEKPFNYMGYYHYRKENDIYMFFNEAGRETYKGYVELPVSSDVILYNAMTNRYEKADYINDGQTTRLYLELNPYDSVIAVLNNGKTQPDAYQKKILNQTMDISDNWKVSLTRAIDYPNYTQSYEAETLQPVSIDHPDFSGHIKYEKTIHLDKAPETAAIFMEHIYETVEVRINNQEAGFKLCPPYEIDLGSLLRDGDNHLEIEVATTPERDALRLITNPMGREKTVLEPTGMFGKIEIKYI